MTIKQASNLVSEGIKKHGVAFGLIIIVWTYSEYRNHNLYKELSRCHEKISNEYKNELREILKEIKEIDK